MSVTLAGAGIVTHDAGGAEILSSLMRQYNLCAPIAVSGPAIQIFARKVPNAKRMELMEVIHRCDWLLSGTGWQSEFELDAIDAARAAGKRAVAFLDHWVNYRERFVRGPRLCLPDELWVGDEYAQSMAQEYIPEVPVRLVGNPYLDEIKRACVEAAAPYATGTALYVCEPVREHALLRYANERHWGYVEEEALRYFLAELPVLMPDVKRIVLRPHPAERHDKYAWALRNTPPFVVLGGDKPLIEEIAHADLVAGCESMAMVVALIAGKRVIGCIPPGGKACALPHTEIQFLRGYR